MKEKVKKNNKNKKNKYKNRRKKSNKKRTNNRLDKNKLLISIILFSLVSLTTYLLFHVNLLDPRIDEKKMSYVSFNNNNTTDMLKITNISKMSNKFGMSSKNTNSIKLKVEGKINSEYEIVLYSITNDIDLENIHYFIKTDKIKKDSTLDKVDSSNDGGRIIHCGRVNNKNIIIRLWIDEKYNKKVFDNSYEIKIKARQGS